MDDSLDPRGDLLAGSEGLDNTAQAYPRVTGSYKHAFALGRNRYTRAQERSMVALLPRPRATTRHPIPSEVLVQLEGLLSQAIQSMVDGTEPPILSPMVWDAILILRRTGISCSELVHLEAPSQADQQGCLEQGSDGLWNLLVKPESAKASQDSRIRIPIESDSGVIEAVQRQNQRILDIPDHLGKHYLFRCKQGLLTSTVMRTALLKLAQHITFEGEPYVIATYQFRHTFDRDTSERVRRLSTIGMCLGHASPYPPVYRYYPPPPFQSALLSAEYARFQERVREFQLDEERSSQEKREEQDEGQEGQEK